MTEYERIIKELENVEEHLIGLSEGYLGKLEDEDPTASAKSEIDGLIDCVRTTILNIDDIYNN